jgi:hypothetical protein
LRNHLPWLCQGDIFANAPVVDVTLTATNGLQLALPTGPSVLLTHECAMDKPNQRGEPRAELLQFARLRAIDSLPRDRQMLLRQKRNDLGPFDILYLGEIGELGESFILLTDPYHLPARFFSLKFEDYSSHPDAGPGARYVTPQANDTRLCRMDEAQVELLRQKMLAFWTRLRE